MDGAPQLDAQLAELERQRRDGSISELTFNVRRNLLITRSEQLSRRRNSAAMLTPPPAPPPVRRQRSRRQELRERERSPSRRSALQYRTPARADRRPAPVYRSAPTRSRRRRLPPSLPWALGAVVAVAVVTFGLLLHQHSAASPTTPAVSPAADLSSTPSPLPAETAIGVAQSTPLGASVELVAYADHFTSQGLINNPLPSGGFYAAVELRVCAAKDLATTFSPFAFNLVEPDQTQAGIATGPTEGLQPALQLEAVAPGHCASGWLSYGVNARPTALADSADDLSWAIP